MSSPQDDPLLQLAARISDGEPIDWSAIESMGLDPSQLRVARHLKTVAGIASARQSKKEDAASNEDGKQPKWGHLVILERVGGGAYGDVVRAWDPQLEREVALKLLRPRQDEEDLRGQDKLIAEARLLARISDPNVATVYGAAIHEGQAGIWMEYVRGRTLQEIIEEQGPRSAGEAVVMGMEVCRAAAMVHKAGVVHRDIKADNIIRGEGGRIVLTDFGSGYAIPADGSDGSVAVSGTPLYMAPEVLNGEEPTPQSDIYSIGVLLYFLLSGTYPVRGSNLEEIRRGHHSGTRQRLSETRPQLPHSVCRIVEKALHPKPQRRYRSARQMEDALAAALTDSGLGIEQRGQPFVPLRPGRVLAGSAALLTSLVMLFLLVSYLTPEARPLRIIVEDLELSFSDSEVSRIELELVQILGSNRRFRLISREELTDAFILTRLGKDPVIDRSAADTLVRRGFADFALDFELEQKGSRTHLSVQAYAPRPLGRLDFNSSPVANRNGLASALADILTPLLAKLQSRAGEFPEVSYPPITTGSLNALQHYSRALEAFETSLESTVAHLKVAVEADPECASAHRLLSLLQSALGDSKASLQSIKTAFALREGVTEPERELIKVQYQQMTGQHWAAKEAGLKAAAQLKDYASEFLRLLANDFNRLGSPELAVDYLRDAIESDPANRFEYEKRIAFMTVLAGDLELALKLVEELHREEPSTPYVLWTESMARMALREFEKANETLVELEKGLYGEDKRPEDRIFYSTVGLFYQAQMALMRGRHQDALDSLVEGLPQGRKYNNGFMRYQSSLRLAHLHFLSGQEQLALSALNCLLEEDFPPQFLYMLRDAALLLSFWDRWEDAAPFITRLRQLHESYPGWLSEKYLRHVAGEEALRNGELDVAQELIGLGQNPLDDILSLWSLARLYESEGACDQAVHQYERILSRKGRVIYWQSPDILAMASYRAANCYEDMGKPEEARKIREDLEAYWQPDELGILIRQAAEASPHQDTSK